MHIALNRPLSQFAANTPHGELTLFEQPWWLDAALGGEWRRAEVKWDCVTVGQMPFHVKRKFGFRIIRNPPYTRMISPRFFPPPAKPVNDLHNRVRILRELLKQLPDHDRFRLQLSPPSDALLPFVVLGFNAETTFTFQSEASSSSADAWRELNPKTRSAIRAAERSFYTTSHSDVERLIHLSKKQHRGHDHNDYPALSRIWEACSSRSCSTIMSVRDRSGHDVASALLVWDDSFAYFLVSARDGGEFNKGATSLLLWEALKYAKKLGVAFDVDGFHSTAAARFLTQFGCRPVARNIVNRSRPLAEIVFTLRDLIFGKPA